MTQTTKEPPTYTFGRRDRGGILVGFRGAQVLLIGAGFAAVLLGLLLAGSQGGVLGFAVFTAASIVALTPVGGQTAVDWTRPLANHTHNRVTRGKAYRGGPYAMTRRKEDRIDLPGVGQHLQLHDVTTPTGSIAALRMGTQWTMVLRVRGSNYVLADRASQERRIADWGALLSQCGQEGSRISKVQWLERTVPDSGHDLEDWWTHHGDQSTPYATQYADLIAKAGPAATRHDSYVAISIDAHKLRRPIRQAGCGTPGTAKVLTAEVSWVTQALARADIDVIGALDPHQFASLVRSQYDPVWSAGHDDAALSSLRAAGPIATEAHWDHYRTDSGIHAVFWIAEWPSVPVEAAWIYPLVALGGVRRTVSVTAEPIAPSRSLRELRSKRVAKRADESQRRRLGQVETAQDDAEYAALERREQELVRGHTEYRYTGWITVSATTRDELEAACSTVEQVAVRSALELRRVYGEVDQAFLFGGLPLTLGVTA
ncbi:hypothetical protein GCM10027596_31820 [Nocardioides korecus]